MIVSYRNKKTERFAAGEYVKAFSGFSRQAENRLDRLEAAHSLQDLGALPGNRLEAFKGDRAGQDSIRINDQWRICFEWRRGHQARSMSSSPIIIEEGTMVRTAIHPGEHLAEELRELKISAAELSRQIEVPVNRVTSIINGQRGVTADTALRLGHWFGTSAEFWLNLQNLYELRLAQIETGDRIGKLPRLTGRRRKSDRAPPLVRSRG